MDPHDTTRPTRSDAPRATAPPPPRTFGPQGPTLGDLIDAYLQDYLVRQFRSHRTARGRTAHLTAFFGRDARATALTTYQIRQYQLARRAAGAATGTINRETSALHRMGTLAVHWGWLDTVPGFPDRLRENPPRQGFFEHPEYLAVRAHLPAPWQDILDVAYYSGWRKQEILGLTWEEIDEAGGVIRLSPGRSKTLVGRVLPISQPIAEAIARRRARRDPDSPLVFHRDGIPIRRWRTAWRTACQSAGVPTRFLHDCRRTAARNLIRANVPERVAMLLTGHKSRAIFDRYNIIHEQELLDAGDQLVAYLAQQAQAVPARRRSHAAATDRLDVQLQPSRNPAAPPAHRPTDPDPSASSWLCRRDDRVSSPGSSPGNRSLRVAQGVPFHVATGSLFILPLPSSTATTLFTSRNCSTPGTNSSPIWRSRRRLRPSPVPRGRSYDAAPRKGARPPGTGAWRSGRPGSLLALAPHRSGRAGSAASGSSTDGFATRRRVPAGPGSQAMATAIPKAYLASLAIRCRDVETRPNLGVLAVFPSTGATCRCPLPSTGSRGLNSPASAVL